MLENFETYFGLKSGGADLLGGVKSLSAKSLESLKSKIEQCHGRIFFLGNGGSYDNARWLAQLCRQLGKKAKAPGMEEDYILTLKSKGYDEIFLEGLRFDELCSHDFVVGISGSGNSKNVINALEYAKGRGVGVFALGGRDGGEMLKTVGKENCLIAASQSMEAIEDLHNFIFVIIAESIRLGKCVDLIKGELLTNIRSFLSQKNLQKLLFMVSNMITTIENEGRTFVLGLGIGSNHFRADMGRGATNALPIRGLSCPEVFTMNSLQATANDDGTDFLIVDGLVKYKPGPKDFAILCDISQPAVKTSEDFLSSRKVPYSVIGKGGVDTQMFKKEYYECVVTMVGHVCSYVIRRELLKRFEIKPLVQKFEFRKSQKKLSDKETAKFEEELKEEGKLSSTEAVTFCYGQAFAVQLNSEFEREYY